MGRRHQLINPTKEDTVPTKLKRIQVCTQPDLYADIETIAKARNKTLSFTAHELLEEILKYPHVQEELKKAAQMYGQVPAQEDPRTQPAHQPHPYQLPAARIRIPKKAAVVKERPWWVIEEVAV